MTDIETKECKYIILQYGILGVYGLTVNPILDTKISSVLRHAQGTPPLDSETGWTGEL